MGHAAPMSLKGYFGMLHAAAVEGNDRQRQEQEQMDIVGADSIVVGSGGHKQVVWTLASFPCSGWLYQGSDHMQRRRDCRDSDCVI